MTSTRRWFTRHFSPIHLEPDESARLPVARPHWAPEATNAYPIALGIIAASLTWVVNASASTQNMMTSFYNPTDKTEHVTFIPSFQNGKTPAAIPLTEFYHDTQWHMNQDFRDPTDTTPLRGSTMTSLFDGSVEHVFFGQSSLSANANDHNEVWELYNAGGWSSHDLTRGATPVSIVESQSCNGYNASCARSFTGLSSLWDGSVEHVFYGTGNGHLMEVYNPGGGWFMNDLTTDSGDSGVDTENIKSMWDGTTEYVVYTKGDAIDMVSCGPGGCWNTFTRITDIVGDASMTCCAGFAAGSTLNVFFVDLFSHVKLAYRVSPGHGVTPFWSEEDVTALSGVKQAPVNALNSYYDGVSFHVFFVGSDSHIYELYSTSSSSTSWASRDVTVSAGDVNVAKANYVEFFQPHLTALTGFSDGTFNHLFSVGTDGHIHEAYHSASIPNANWIANDLNVSTGVGNTILATD